MSSLVSLPARSSLLLAVAIALCSGACSEPPNNPPASKCAQVRCTGTATCDPVTGDCVARDAGPSDAGTAPDAGAADAGRDAGQSDAGSDAGVSRDAGSDAGLDAGAPLDAGFSFDAGCAADAVCFGLTQHCRLETGTCVECLSDSHCFSSVAPRCDPSSGQCFECLSGADCANPTPICDPIRQCLPCDADSKCGPGRRCDLSGNCLPLPDACGSEEALNLPTGTGTVSFSVDPSLALDDTAGSCNGPGGPELVYRFTTSAVRDLAVTLTPLGLSTARPVLFLRRASCAAGSQQACDAPAASGASILVAGLPADTWFLFVESALGTPGRMELTVALTAPSAPPSNDSCTAPRALGLSTGAATALGNLALAVNDGTGATCSVSSGSGNDLTYQFTVGLKSNVTVTAKAAFGSTLHPAFSVRSACASSASELGCAASSAGQAVSVSLSGLDAGTYAVWVDTADGTTGAFQLDVRAAAVVDNDSCAAPGALSFGAGSTATAIGDTSAATNGNLSTDPTPSCSPSARTSGRDVVYAYTLSQARDVTVSVTPTGSAPTFQPVVSVRAASCSATATSSELGCSNPGTPSVARLPLLNQPAGTYFVWVDGSQDTAGPFQLEVAQAAPTPPPANDACAGATPLAFTNGLASVTGSTVQAANDNFAGDVSPTCSPQAKQSGRDVVYTFTLAAPKDVTVTVTPSGSPVLTPTVYVRKASCSSQLLGDELVCLERTGVTTALLTALPAGTYWLWVDGTAGTSGAFSLDVMLSPPSPPPANDACPGAQALAFTSNVASVQATTLASSNANSPNDNAPACGTVFFPRRYGRDLVYSYSLPGPRDVDLQVTPAPGSLLAPVLYVRPLASCGSGGAGSEVACLAAAASQPARLYLPNQPAGAFAVFVDSDSWDTGPFTLTVTLKPATPPPSNDTCSAPATITAGPTGVSGSTLGALDTYSVTTTPAYATACRQRFFSGRDALYQFTATATGPVTATLTPQGGFDAALMLLQGTCAATSCVRAVDAAGPGGSEAIAFTATAGSTWFFVVDAADGSLAGSSGAFTLVVQ